MNWKLKKIKVSDLKEYSKNPRQLSEKGLKDLEKSIKRFGIAEPIVINSDFTICGGHGRKKILERLNINEVDCYIPERKLSEKQFEELNIRLNKNIAGEFDFDILANEFEMNDLIDWGFEENELTGFLDNNEQQDSIPDIPEIPLSKLGDIFVIDGKHKIMCGDATKYEDVKKLMNGKNVDLIFTDPPYGVDYASKNEFLNKYDKGNCIQKKIQSDDSLIDIKSAFVNMRSIMHNNSCYYIFSAGGGELMTMMMMMMNEAGLPPRHMIIWVKNNHVLGRADYNYKHEPIHYGWVKSHKFYGNGEQKFSVWEYDKPLKSELHPTMKPVKLITNAILNSTQGSNNIVCDIFLGSGSTLVASEQTKRICYGMEIEPVYIDVILKRYNNLYPGATFQCENREFDFDELFRLKNGD